MSAKKQKQKKIEMENSENLKPETIWKFLKKTRKRKKTWIIRYIMHKLV